jgi:plastocyanin
VEVKEWQDMKLSTRILLGIALVAALASSGCGGDSTSTTGGSTACSAATATAANTVTMAGMAFSPPCIQVAAGTTVTFRNDDTTTHDVTANDGTYQSAFLSPAPSYTRTSATAGTSAYHCSIHPMMVGTVIVQ